MNGAFRVDVSANAIVFLKTSVLPDPDDPKEHVAFGELGPRPLLHDGNHRIGQCHVPNKRSLSSETGPWSDHELDVRSWIAPVVSHDRTFLTSSTGLRVVSTNGGTGLDYLHRYEDYGRRPLVLYRRGHVHSEA
jgi:hypothetical protein